MGVWDKLDTVVNHFPGFSWLDGHKTTVAGGIGALAFIIKIGAPLVLAPQLVLVIVPIGIILEYVSGALGVWGLTGKVIKQQVVLEDDFEGI